MALFHHVFQFLELAGVDVIIAHRLLKNGLVHRRAYLLLTEAALRWTGVDPTRAGLVAHTERYEYLGDIRCFVRDLDLAGRDRTLGTGSPATALRG